MTPKAVEPNILNIGDRMKIKEVRHLLTYACNLSCKHCYLGAGSKLAERFPPSELTDTTLNQFYDFFKPEVVSATGGEPLLRPNAIQQLARTLAQYGGSLEVVTNGMLVTSKFVDELRSVNPNVFFQVSLDGSREYHNMLRGSLCAYDAALQAIKLVTTHGLTVKARLTATNANFREVPEVIRALDDIDSDRIKLVIRPVVPRGRAAENQLSATFDYTTLDEYAKLAKTISVETTDNVGKCGCGVDTIAIDPQGNIYPCTYFTHDPKYRMGTIWDDPVLLQEHAEFAAYNGTCFARVMKSS